MVELMALDKLQQMVELRIRFAREAHDEGSAKNSMRERGFDPIDNAVIHLPLPRAVHRPQNFRMGVL